MAKMTAHKGCTFFEELHFLEICLAFSKKKNTELFDECLHTVLNVCLSVAV